MGVLIVLAIVAYVVYLIATKEQRAAKKEEKRRLREEKKRKMKEDLFIELNLEALFETLTDLKGGAVQILRTGGRFYLVFRAGDVYIQTRWRERSGDQYVERKDTKCLIDRVSSGKNPFSSEENYIFIEIVEERLRQIPWMSIANSFHDGLPELRIEKSGNIPEAF